MATYALDGAVAPRHVAAALQVTFPYPPLPVSSRPTRRQVLEMEGLLVYPAGYAKGTRVPLALNVHGGPAGTHSSTFTPGNRRPA